MDLFKRDRGKLIRRAERHLARREIEKALDAFNCALEIEGEAPQAHLLNTIGDLYLNKMGDEAQAKRFFLRAAQEYVREGKLAMAIATYRKLQRLDPNDPNIALASTDLCIQKGWIDEAIRNLRTVMSSSLAGDKLGSAQSDIAARALALEEKILALNPNATDVLIDCGLLFRKLGRMRDYSHAMRKAASLLKEQGRLERCLAIISELRAFEPDDADLLVSACDLLVKLNRGDEAVSLLDSALSGKGEDPRLLKLYAETLTRIGRYDAAAEVYHRLLYVDAAGFEEALKFTQRLIEDKELERAVAWLGRLLEPATMLQRSEIAYLLRRVLSVDPENAAARNLLGQIVRRHAEGEEEEPYAAYMGAGSSDMEAIAESLLGQRSQDNGSSLEDFLASIELLQKYGHLERAIEALKARAASEPGSPIYREKLLQLYIRRHMSDEATVECLELFKLYNSLRLADKAQEVLKVAFQINPGLAFKLAEASRVQEAQRQYENMKAFSGSLDAFSLLDIIQFIDISRKTGTLAIKSSQGQGKVLFNEGQIADAEFEGRSGIEAIYQLIRISEGAFEFETASQPFQSRMNLSTINLLLEGLKMLDEERARKEGLETENQGVEGTQRD